MDEETLKLTGLQMEYSFLSELIIKRFEMRQKMIQLTLTLAAAFLGVALTRNVPPSVALVFPPIAALLEIQWFYNEKRQTLSIKHFKELENRIKELNLSWETQRDLRISSRFFIPAVSGLFLFSKLMAVFIGVLLYDPSIHNWRINVNLTAPFVALLFVDFISILISLILICLLRDLHNA